jgi:membrane-associated protease RseP (regulator of RpoE activity)
MIFLGENYDSSHNEFKDVLDLDKCSILSKEEIIKQPKRLEFQFPFLVLRIDALTRLYNRFGKWRVSRLYSWLALVIMPFITGFGLIFISYTFFIVLTIPEAREIGRELGPQASLLIPGINPYLPIIYGWIGILVTILVHEVAHGIIARNVGINVKSSVLLFLLVIPVGAGVDVDEEHLEKAPIKDSTRILASGVGGNVLIGIVCIALVLVITSGLSPVVDGLYITKVIEGLPANNAGIIAGDVITIVNNQQIRTIDDFESIMEGKNVGDIIELKVVRGEEWGEILSFDLILSEQEGEVVIGVNIVEMLLSERLSIYLNTPLIHLQPPTFGSSQNFIPFSEALHGFYTHPLGSYWYIPVNIFFWIWFLNINVALINALPIYPLDGGRVFKSLIKNMLANRVNEKTIQRLVYIVSITLVSIIVLSIFLPFLF